MDEEGYELLNQRRGAWNDDMDDYIVLTTHNKIADETNIQHLQRLEAEKYIFKASIKDDFNQYAYPTEINLELKAGARIMFIKNDTGEERRYFNGKLATVNRIKEKRYMCGLMITGMKCYWKRKHGRIIDIN